MNIKDLYFFYNQPFNLSHDQNFECEQIPVKFSQN